MHHVPLHKRSLVIGTCSDARSVITGITRKVPDMHSKTKPAHSSSQMQVSQMYKRKLTSLGIKDLGMTLQSRKEGKQKGTSVSSMKQSSRQKHQAMVFPIAGKLASQELAQARHGTTRDSLESSRLWTGANKRCTIIKAKINRPCLVPKNFTQYSLHRIFIESSDACMEH